MAKRDKLTQRQKRQVARTQKKRLEKHSLPQELGELSSPIEGLLVSRYGEQADVLDLSNHQKHRCYLRQNLGAPVPGDKVIFRLDPNEQGVVETIHERHSVLQRPSPHQGLKPVVANIDKVFVVVAPLPDFSSLLLDRYLVAIRDAGIPVHILANKWDLSEEIASQSIEAQLKLYQKLGYPVTRISTKQNIGLEELRDSAKHISSVLVGQSGVGKSSIINQLFPQQHSKVDIVSENSRLGQHTTTASQLFLFDTAESIHEGFIIDSPGIRDFGLWHMDSHTVADGFIEFDPFIGACKFRDCKHVDEPGCAIIQAVDNNEISRSRWSSYCKIIATEEN